MYEEYQRVTKINKFGDEVISERLIIKHDEAYIKELTESAGDKWRLNCGRLTKSEALRAEKLRDRTYMKEGFTRDIIDAYEEFKKSLM